MGQYVIVENSVVVGGPYHWDGVSAWTPPHSGDVMTLGDAFIMGFIDYITAGPYILKAIDVLESFLLPLGVEHRFSDAETLPALTIGTTEVAVEWDEDLPSTNYFAIPVITGNNSASRCTVAIKDGSKTVSGCTVLVSSPIILGSGQGTLQVLAIGA